MESKWFGSIFVLACSAGLALAQTDLAVKPPAPEFAASAPATPGLCNGCDPSTGSWGPRDGICLGPEENDGRYPDKRFDLRAEYLYWFLKRGPNPTLVGVVPASVFLASNTNSLPPPGSIVPLFGGPERGEDLRGQNGLRLSAGTWLGCDGGAGFNAEFFLLERGSRRDSFQSGSDPIVGPVFTDPAGNKRIVPVSVSNLSGTVNVAVNNRLWGAEANARTRLGNFFGDRLEGFVGFRYLAFDEGLELSGFDIPPRFSPSFNYFDSLGVHNRFYGGQVGLSSDFTSGRWFMTLLGKLAIGAMHETGSVGGATTIFPPVGMEIPTLRLAGGVLAQPTNIGRIQRDRFAIVPEITLNAGVQVTDHLRAFVGYNFLFIDRLVRATGLIDAVDPTLVPVLGGQPHLTAVRPAPQLDDGRFWAQGLNVGLEVQY
jgi:hypothetical protein